MKSLCLLIVSAAPFFAQEPPAAPPTLQLHPPDLSFRDFKLPGRPNPFVMVNPVKANSIPALKLEILEKPPATCAIPLLQVEPKGNFTMKVVKPTQPVVSMPDIRVPAPVCKDWNR
jgi:hypothetical protein